MGADGDAVASRAARQYLALKSAKGIGPVLARRLIEHFGSIEGVFDAPASRLEQVERVSRKRAEAIRAAVNSTETEKELEEAAARGVRIVCERDAEYPAGLKHLPDPPICLYVAGHIQREDMLALGVVGTRRCTRYGCEQATRFSELLVKAGFTVVSGLARGIDGYAHKGALAAGGRTVAVLANGLNTIYPPEHEDLAERICGSGAVVAEVPMGTPPNSDNFEPRNRIIAGMSVGVLLVEAGSRSGGLLTVKYAGEYNREVFAVPGQVDSPASAGTNALIRDGGAKLVVRLEDIIEELGEVGRMLPFSGEQQQLEEQESEPSRPRPPLEKELQVLLDALEAGYGDVEGISAESGLPIPKVMAGLMGLQLRGLARQLPGNRFEATSRSGAAGGV